MDFHLNIAKQRGDAIKRCRAIFVEFHIVEFPTKIPAAIISAQNVLTFQWIRRQSSTLCSNSHTNLNDLKPKTTEHRAHCKRTDTR